MKDVHTEHCCRQHGCKYGDADCTVELGIVSQSHPCEHCDDGWSTGEPTEPGHYWFYGWVHGEHRKTDHHGKPHKPEFRYVKVNKISNGVVCVIDGHFIYDFRPLKGKFRRVEFPEIPRDMSV